MTDNNNNNADTSKSPLGDLGVSGDLGVEIELRSEEFQEVLGSVPPWILRWGITILAVVVVILLTGSAVVKYPDVISAQITLTGSTPPATLVAHASGKIKELYVKDNQEVKAGEYLAVIDNSANTEDILFLKNYLDSLPLNPLKGTLLNPFCSYPLAKFSKSTVSVLRSSVLFTTDFFRKKGAYLYSKAS